jgi:hypothetical protein
MPWQLVSWLPGTQLEQGLSLDDENAVEIRFVVKCNSAEQHQNLLSQLKLTADGK